MPAGQGRPIHPPHPTSGSSPGARGSASPLPAGLCPKDPGWRGVPSTRFHINVSPQGSPKVEGACLPTSHQCGVHPKGNACVSGWSAP